MEPIFNLTQHEATAEQREAGVVEPTPEVKAAIQKLLTFTHPPSRITIRGRAIELADICEAQDGGIKHVMIGGAPYLMGPLEDELGERGLVPVYSFTERVVVEEALGDGTVKKTALFRHKCFI